MFETDDTRDYEDWQELEAESEYYDDITRARAEAEYESKEAEASGEPINATP